MQENSICFLVLKILLQLFKVKGCECLATLDLWPQKQNKPVTQNRTSNDYCGPAIF